MNLTSPVQVREWCQAHDFHPSRTLGQNFLIDRNILDGIIAASGVGENSRVLEIGPGLGVVTAGLLAAGTNVIAIEKDRRLAAWLRESLVAEPNLKLIEADALETDWDAMLGTRFDALVSNLPYSVGTRILLDVATHALAPPRMVVTVQLEVAERLAAAPGASARGQAGVWIQRAFDVEIVRIIKSTCFWPKPDISSALVRLSRHDRHSLAPDVLRRYHELTRHAFMHRRKQLAAAMRHAPPEWRQDAAVIARLLEECGADPRARAEDLDVAQWCQLAQNWPNSLKKT